MADITEKQLKTLKKLIESAETNLAGAKELLTSLTGSDDPVSITAATSNTAQSGKVIEGAFDGQHLSGPDGKHHPVTGHHPPNSTILPGHLPQLLRGPILHFL